MFGGAIAAAIGGMMAAVDTAPRVDPSKAAAPTSFPTERLALDIEYRLITRLNDLWEAAGVGERAKFRIVPKIRVDLANRFDIGSTEVLVRADIRVLLANGELQPSSPLTQYDYHKHIEHGAPTAREVGLIADEAAFAVTKAIVADLPKFAKAAAELSKEKPIIDAAALYGLAPLKPRPAVPLPMTSIAGLYAKEMSSAMRHSIELDILKAHVTAEKKHADETMTKVQAVLRFKTLDAVYDRLTKGKPTP